MAQALATGGGRLDEAGGGERRGGAGDCAQNIGVGLLRGLDDTKSGFRITLIGYWMVGLPTAWALGYAAGLHTLGIWLGLLAGLATTALLLLRRYGTALRMRAAAAPQACA